MNILNRMLKNYGKNTLTGISRSLGDAIVRFDPEGASEAEIESIEEMFDQVNREFSRAKTEFRKEQDEADTITALREQRLAAADHISNQLANDPDNVGLNSGLNELITALEDMQPDVERELEEAADAKEVMDELELTVNAYADKLKTARSQMKSAMRNMEKANRKAERADEKARRAAMLAGLRKDTSSLGSALESMNRQAEEALQSADAAERKAGMLGKTKVDNNEAVAAAMAAVSGAPAKPQTAAERLAALRNK